MTRTHAAARCYGVSQRCDPFVRSITVHDAFWAAVGRVERRRRTTAKIERQTGVPRAKGPIPTYKPPYSTYSSLLYASSTGLTPRLHSADGIACFGATGRSSSCAE